MHILKKYKFLLWKLGPFNSRIMLHEGCHTLCHFEQIQWFQTICGRQASGSLHHLIQLLLCHIYPAVICNLIKSMLLVDIMEHN